MNDQTQTDLTLKAEIVLYWDLFIPRGISEPAPLLVAVHGYGAHKRYMMREAREVAPDNFVIASIQGPHQHYRPAKDGGYRVGFGWLSEYRPEEYVGLHHKFVLDVIDKLVDDGTVDSDRVFLYGFSQACALNFRFAFTHPNRLQGIIGVCGGIPGDMDSNPLYSAFQGDALYIYGDNDEFYTQVQFREFNERLFRFLPRYRSNRYNAKHEITDEMRKDISAWLASVI